MEQKARGAPLKTGDNGVRCI